MGDFLPTFINLLTPVWGFLHVHIEFSANFQRDFSALQRFEQQRLYVGVPSLLGEVSMPIRPHVYWGQHPNQPSSSISTAQTSM